MILRHKRTGSLLLLFLILVLTVDISAQLSIYKDYGSVKSFTVKSEKIEVPSGGGFIATDVTDGGKCAINFVNGSVHEIDGKAVFNSQEDGLQLYCEFIAYDEYVLATGRIENLRKTDRAIILDYCVPVAGEEKVFCNELSSSVTVCDMKEYEGNMYPLAAMCTDDSGIAIAIPPSEPRIFGMTGNKRGLSVRFYLGLSPDTANFPNIASFVFIIYPVETEWGFRSALSKYYSFYPDYYTQRVKKYGLWMFQMEGRVPPNIHQYAYNEISMGGDSLKDDLERDKVNDIITFPYMIVGQREIKFLAKLPSDYNDAMKAFRSWSVEDHSRYGLTKENAASKGDIYLRREIESSACKTSDSKYALMIRNTPWGQNSVTFKINPNPKLFFDKNEKICVGRNALDSIDEWLKKYHDFAGIYVDSLGRLWPALLNYRRDHFKYARYPLTFNPKGEVALHNQLSHYEFLEELRSKLRSQNKSLFANGIYSYNVAFDDYHTVASASEHYNAKKLGRFFMASLVDIAGSEAGVSPPHERWEFIRSCMGKKICTLLNYYWEDKQDVEHYINKALCYGVLATNCRNFLTGVEYEDNPDGYWRDKQLIDWFVPLISLICDAGWEPVTYAKTDVDNILVERYGSGDIVYFTVMNESETISKCVLTVDMNSLGFGSDKCQIDEIARGLDLKIEGTEIVLTLDTAKTCILRLSR